MLCNFSNKYLYKDPYFWVIPFGVESNGSGIGSDSNNCSGSSSGRTRCFKNSALYVSSKLGQGNIVLNPYKNLKLQ